MVILFCKGENQVLKIVCFNGTYTQAEDYINGRAEIPEGTTRTLIVPEENYIFNIDESLRRENEAFEQAITQENCRIHKRTKKKQKRNTNLQMKIIIQVVEYHLFCLICYFSFY